MKQTAHWQKPSDRSTGNWPSSPNKCPQNVQKIIIDSKTDASCRNQQIVSRSEPRKARKLKKRQRKPSLSFARGVHLVYFFLAEAAPVRNERLLLSLALRAQLSSVICRSLSSLLRHPAANFALVFFRPAKPVRRDPLKPRRAFFKRQQSARRPGESSSSTEAPVPLAGCKWWVFRCVTVDVAYAGKVTSTTLLLSANDKQVKLTSCFKLSGGSLMEDFFGRTQFCFGKATRFYPVAKWCKFGGIGLPIFRHKAHVQRTRQC